MSRSGYHDDLDPLDLGRWRGQVASAIRGKRGQAFLRDFIAALDALPEKKLVKDEIVTDDGAVCALGALGRQRGVDLETLDPYDYDQLGATFGIAHQLAQEVMFWNDKWDDTPEKRWQRMRDWAVKNVQQGNSPDAR